MERLKNEQAILTRYAEYCPSGMQGIELLRSKFSQMPELTVLYEEMVGLHDNLIGLVPILRQVAV